MDNFALKVRLLSHSLSELKEVRRLNKDAAFLNNHPERLQSIGQKPRNHALWLDQNFWTCTEYAFPYFFFNFLPASHILFWWKIEPGKGHNSLDCDLWGSACLFVAIIRKGFLHRSCDYNFNMQRLWCACWSACNRYNFPNVSTYFATGPYTSNWICNGSCQTGKKLYSIKGFWLTKQPSWWWKNEVNCSLPWWMWKNSTCVHD